MQLLLLCVCGVVVVGVVKVVRVMMRQVVHLRRLRLVVVDVDANVRLVR